MSTVFGEPMSEGEAEVMESRSDSDGCRLFGLWFIVILGSAFLRGVAMLAVMM